uniref:Uncharacterized protein n=1 Tax=Oryza glumipatula TaxID=40148 RepID=A0A0D9Z6S8_9ORYZ
MGGGVKSKKEAWRRWTKSGGEGRVKALSYTTRTFDQAYRNNLGEDSSRRQAAKAKKARLCPMKRQHGRKPYGESRGMKHVGFPEDGPCWWAIRAKTMGRKPCREGHRFCQEPDLTGRRPNGPSCPPGVLPTIGLSRLAQLGPMHDHCIGNAEHLLRRVTIAVPIRCRQIRRPRIHPPHGPAAADPPSQRPGGSGSALPAARRRRIRTRAPPPTLELTAARASPLLRPSCRPRQSMSLPAPELAARACGYRMKGEGWRERGSGGRRRMGRWSGGRRR